MFNTNKKDELARKADCSIYSLLPLRDLVVFPNMLVPLFVGRERSIKALEYTMSRDREIFLAAQKDAKMDNPSPKDIFVRHNHFTLVSYKSV